MTTLNVNEGASSSAGSHNELSSLLPTSSEPAINPSTETLQRTIISKPVPIETIMLNQPTEIHGRVERSRIRHRLG